MRFWTKKLEIWGPCGDFRDLRFTDKKLTAGGLTLRVPDNEHWRNYFFKQSRYAMRPISVDLPGYRTFWLTTKYGRIKEGRKRWIHVEAVHALEYLNHIHMWPAWWLPPEIQPPSTTGIGGAITVLKGELQGQLFRLQGSLWSIPKGNLFDLRTWNVFRNALWPLMVDPRGVGLADTSPWTITDARMDRYWDVMQEVCKTNNIVPQVNLYIHGEDPQPFPNHFKLDRNTLIVNFVEMGNRVAFTGTVADGVIRTLLEVADDTLGAITYPILGEDRAWNQYLQKAAGTLPGLPLALYRTGEYTNVSRVEQMTHIPLATRVTGGGKSPNWMNDLVINAGNFIAGAIGAAFGVFGLSLGVLTDQLKDRIMAFHSREDLALANEAGPLRFQETFVSGQGTGLSLDLMAAMQSTAFDHRGYTSAAIEVTNGAPHFIGRDIEKGSPVAYELPDGTVEVDSLEEIEYEESPDRIGYRLQIGSGDAEREPGAIALGKFRKLASVVSRVALGG
ncbi:hypothetical protein A6411_10635 [Prescottella equi]|nr:hypothetical protein A6411_10635 [Prescottella equi]